MCAIIMILQKQYFAIMKHDDELPAWPRNERQFHAARYRRGQVRTLRCVSDSLLDEIRRIAGLNPSEARDTRIVRLEHILMESPQGFLVDYRAALNAGLGTRNATKIREKGWVQCAFTVWLSGLCLWDSENRQKRNEASSSSNFSTTISQWLDFLRRVYGNPPISGFDESGSKLNNDTKFDFASGLESAPLAYQQDERLLLVQSYLAVIKAAVNKHPKSIFRNSELTISYLAWCLNIIEAEGIMCPNLVGKIGEEDDEFILFLENEM